MAKPQINYICTSCEYLSNRWLGQCPTCSEWNCFEEKIVYKNSSNPAKATSEGSYNTLIKPLNKVEFNDKSKISTQISELDRVLGGGLIQGQVILIGGEPGIGKSTLLLQLAGNFNKSIKDKKVLYIAGEESPVQIKSRASRLQVDSSNIDLLDTTSTEEVALFIEENSKDYSLIIIDSIQSMSINRLNSGFGSVGQVKESASLLTHTAKRLNVPMFIVGQVTKDGNIAGPKILEHIVDSVLYFEGDSDHLTRILRCTKNRFGSVNEVGLFEMDSIGLKSIVNPAEIFLKDRSKASGTIVTMTLEGSRVMAVEVQALVTKTNFGFPKRTASGFSLNRLNLLLAVMEKRAGLRFYDQDVYLNVASGFVLNEPAADLAICLSIASSIKDVPFSLATCAFGEVGLGGEIRQVPQVTRRIQEAKEMGFINIFSNEKLKTLRDAIKNMKA